MRSPMKSAMGMGIALTAALSFAGIAGAGEAAPSPSPSPGPEAFAEAEKLLETARAEATKGTAEGDRSAVGAYNKVLSRVGSSAAAEAVRIRCEVVRDVALLSREARERAGGEASQPRGERREKLCLARYVAESRGEAAETDRLWAKWDRLRARMLAEYEAPSAAPRELLQGVAAAYIGANDREWRFVSRAVSDAKRLFEADDPEMRELMTLVARRCDTRAKVLLGLETLPLNTVMWYYIHAGRAHAAMGETDEAIKRYDKVFNLFDELFGFEKRLYRLKYQPKFKRLRILALRLKAEALREAGRTEKAKAVLVKLRREFPKVRGTDIEKPVGEIPMSSTGVVVTLGIGGGTAGGRKRAALKMGGSLASESAVAAALRWLANHQETDGSWALRNPEGSFPETGRVAVTGLALLAFLGSGQTEDVGKYKATVRKAISYLVGQQKANGAVGENNGPDSGWAVGGGYNHAIAGLALVEAYGMSRRSSTKKAAAKAVDYTCRVHQTQGSGWRYKPGQDGDLSVTSWAATQLQAARMAQLKVPKEALEGARKFLESVTVKDGETAGLAAYQPGEKPTAMTAAMGLWSRIMLGESKKSEELSTPADYLVKNLPKWGKDVGTHGGCQLYYWYFGTCAMFQMGGKHWEAWNKSLRDMLVQNQRRGGENDGSWDPVGARDGRRGGRAYTTAMGALCLEVY